jgi:hypothetical protein
MGNNPPFKYLGLLLNSPQSEGFSPSTHNHTTRHHLLHCFIRFLNHSHEGTSTEGEEKEKKTFIMASHNNAGQEEPTVEIPTSDSGSEEQQEHETMMVEEDERSRTRYRGNSKPMREILTAPLDIRISDADVEKLKIGFSSWSMEDKWDLLVEDPDDEGGISIHIIRNWLRNEMYILHIAPKPSSTEEEAGGGSEGGSAKVRGITWEGDMEGTQCGAEQALKEAVILCRGWLDCEFEGLPQYPWSVFWDPSAYKKRGEPDAQPDAQRAVGSDGAGSTDAGSTEGDKQRPKVNKSLQLHVMSLGPRYWNELE